MPGVNGPAQTDPNGSPIGMDPGNSLSIGNKRARYQPVYMKAKEMTYVDIECLRFSYEIRLRREVESRIGTIPTMGQIQSNDFLALNERDLLGHSMLISSDVLPEAYQTYAQCLDLFGADLQGNLFVRQSAEYNASIIAHNKKFDLVIHSSLLEALTPGELRFVLGHELGHVLLGHAQFSIGELLSLTEKLKPGSISPETKDLMYRWTRATELSADRVGLLCCGQLEDAATALFKTLSGLSKVGIDRIYNSFHSQYTILKDHVEKLSDAQSWIGTHPMTPIRFKALELAALDIISLRRQPDSFSRKSFQNIDHKISDILTTFDQYLSACNSL